MKVSENLKRHIITAVPSIKEMEKALFSAKETMRFATDKGIIEVTLTGCRLEDGTRLRLNLEGMTVETKPCSYRAYCDIEKNTGHITFD